MILLNPKKYPHHEIADDVTKEILLSTINWFENKGKFQLKEDDHNKVWYRDFLEFQKEIGMFKNFLTPPEYGDPVTRWDTYRNNQLSEILGFYGLSYWYTWQVSILGLGPIWISENDYIKQKTARMLAAGGIFGFGLSEKDHGADIYSTETVLKYQGNGQYLAEGQKYYIGNGNEAALLSIFGKLQNTEVKDQKYGQYVFFPVSTQHERYEMVKNIVDSQMFVAEYRLNDYPIAEKEILAKGRAAWDMALNTVNIGKFNLGWASIGICTHAFYEAINHASHRILYDHPVTDFPHIQQFFVEAYVRLVAMKLFAQRATDYMRSASDEDRRYLLYNPLVKMWVTLQGEQVIDLLWDVIAAKGYEKDMYFENATRDIRTLPKLEGTVHVNMALVLKFMKNYFFNHKSYPPIPRRKDAQHDSFLFNQPPASKLGEIQFHDYQTIYQKFQSPNLSKFKEQIELFIAFITKTPPTETQTQDFDFLLILGSMFTQIVYGQLILEIIDMEGHSSDIMDRIFHIILRDFSKLAGQLATKPNASEKQTVLLKNMILKAEDSMQKFQDFWQTHVLALKDIYIMNE